MTNEPKKYVNKNETSLPELVQHVGDLYVYLIKKKLLILVFILIGSLIGLTASFIVKPKYTAHLSFALVEKSSSGGLADLASSFGLSGLIGGGGNGAFSGDNLLEIIKSRYAIEQTLLTPVNYKGKIENLVEVYINFSNLRKEWTNNKRHPELQNLCFPVGQKRDSFSRAQDSVLFKIYNTIDKTKSLSIVRKDKKTSIVNVDFTSKDELFSHFFVEKLMDETYRFYKQTRTAQSRANVNMMQHTADSIKNLYEAALYKGAGYSQVNINSALQYAAVPRIKQENNAQMYGTVYAEVLKNLETLKLDLARETPIVQIIDTPRLPLLKEKIGKVKGIAIGGFIGGFLIISFLLSVLYIKNLFKDSK